VQKAAFCLAVPAKFWLVVPDPHTICPALLSFPPLRSQGGHNGGFQGISLSEEVILTAIKEKGQWPFFGCFE
jgi:hypothetical protein